MVNGEDSSANESLNSNASGSGQGDQENRIREGSGIDEHDSDAGRIP